MCGCVEGKVRGCFVASARVGNRCREVAQVNIRLGWSSPDDTGMESERDAKCSLPLLSTLRASVPDVPSSPPCSQPSSRAFISIYTKYTVYLCINIRGIPLKAINVTVFVRKEECSLHIYSRIDSARSNNTFYSISIWIMTIKFIQLQNHTNIDNHSIWMKK